MGYTYNTLVADIQANMEEDSAEFISALPAIVRARPRLPSAPPRPHQHIPLHRSIGQRLDPHLVATYRLASPEVHSSLRDGWLD